MHHTNFSTGFSFHASWLEEAEDDVTQFLELGVAFMEPKDYAKDNVSNTRQNVGEAPLPLRVGAVCYDYPYWLSAFLHTQFKIDWVCCKERTKVIIIKQHYPNLVVHF